MRTTFSLRLSIVMAGISALLITTSCSSGEPKATVIAIDSSDRVSPATEINDEPSEFTVHLSSYDGATETAKQQINQVITAMDNKKLSAYTYLYDNKSGEETMQGVLWFSSDDNGQKDWCLSLHNSNYQMDYFFGKNNELFAIRQYKYDGNAKEQTAEILYNDKEGLLEGSWLKRMNEDTTNLAKYSGDFWYDFLEGWPIYHDTKAMHADKSLQYQQ